MSVRVLSETYDHPEELELAIRVGERELADMPEEPPRRRVELEERLAVMRAVYKRLRRDQRFKLAAAGGVSLAALGAAYWKAPRHAKYAVALAVLTLVGLIAAYWYLFVIGAVAIIAWRLTARRKA